MKFALNMKSQFIFNCFNCIWSFHWLSRSQGSWSCRSAIGFQWHLVSSLMAVAVDKINTREARKDIKKILSKVSDQIYHVLNTKCTNTSSNQTFVLSFMQNPYLLTSWVFLREQDLHQTLFGLLLLLLLF